MDGPVVPVGSVRMGWLRRRTGIERAALLALVGTIAAILVVAFGVFDDSRSQAAARVTQACRPLAALDLRDPEEVSLRDVLALQQVSADAARDVQGLLKNTHGDLRRDVRRVQRALSDAADPYAQFNVEGRAKFLAAAGAAAETLGATCPAPLGVDAAKVVDQRLKP